MLCYENVRHFFSSNFFDLRYLCRHSEKIFWILNFWSFFLDMFCSLCMVSEGIHDCKRRICPVGHVACESCDVNLGKCPECDMKYCNYVCVRCFLACEVPRESLWVSFLSGSIRPQRATTFHPWTNFRNICRGFDLCTRQIYWKWQFAEHSRSTECTRDQPTTGTKYHRYFTTAIGLWMFWDRRATAQFNLNSCWWRWRARNYEMLQNLWQIATKCG